MSLLEYLSSIRRRMLSQKLPGIYRSESNRWLLICFLVVGIINLTFGIIATFVYYQLFESIIPYDSDTSNNIYLPSGRVYLFLEMKDFYQTNLRYSKSISHDQLKGQKPKNLKSTSPLSYEGGRVIYPAGLLPNSFPFDQFEIDGLEIQTNNISWESERNTVKPSSYTRDEVVPPPLWPDYVEIPDLSLNERFVNWIYISPFSSFRKLWGIIDVGTQGTYTLNIISSFPYGEKYVSFVQSSLIGPKNYFLSFGLIIVGLTMIILSFIAYNSFYNTTQ